MSSTVFRHGELVDRLGRPMLRRELANGRWQRAARGVIVTHNGPLSRREVLEVALCVAPPESALAGPSALEVDGFEGFVEEQPVVVLPEGARRPPLVGPVFHWSTELSAADVHPSRAPRRTRPARSLVDFASWSRHDRRVRVVIIAGIQQGLVRPRDVRETLTRRGKCRHRALIVESVLDAGGGVQSLPERDFEQIRLLAGLPRPTRQSTHRRRDGRCYLDVEWADYDAACEIHGIPHLKIAQWDADLDRNNDIVTAGPRILAFSSFAVRHRRRRVAEQVHALLRRGGWRGPELSENALRLLTA